MRFFLYYRNVVNALFLKVFQKVSTNKPKLNKVKHKIFLEDIRSKPNEENKYSPSDNILNDIETVVTLSILISKIICNSKPISLDVAQRKCTTMNQNF